MEVALKKIKFCEKNKNRDQKKKKESLIKGQQKEQGHNLYISGT